MYAVNQDCISLVLTEVWPPSLREVVFDVVGRMRPRSMQVAMLTMKKEWLCFLFLRMHVLLFYSYGARLDDPLGRRSSKFLAVLFFLEIQ